MSEGNTEDDGLGTRAVLPPAPPAAACTPSAPGHDLLVPLGSLADWVVGEDAA